MRLLPDEEIRFKLLENHWVQLTCDRKNYKLVGMSKDNFPALPVFPHALVKIPAKLLADVIAKTTFAISLEESRYTLNGALLVVKPTSLTMVATDGHRLAMVEIDHKFEGFTTETRVLVPKKAMSEIQRLAAESGDDGAVEFAQDESHLFFQFGGRLLTSRKLTGQFPNYEAVLPRDANKTVILERSELQDALRRVSQLADQRSHAVKFMLPSERRASRFPRPAPNTAKPKRPSKKNSRASQSRSVSMRAVRCSIFSPPPPRMASSASS